MPDRRSRTDAGEFDSAESAHLASVAEDFAALVAVFEQQLERLPVSDKETRSHMLKAKAAAERGVQLTKELLERIKPSPA